MRSDVAQGLGRQLSVLLDQLQEAAVVVSWLLQFSHQGFVQEHLSREACDIRATLQTLKFLQLDSEKELDNMVFASSFCYLCLRCIKI